MDWRKYNNPLVKFTIGPTIQDQTLDSMAERFVIKPQPVRLNETHLKSSASLNAGDEADDKE